MGDDVLKSEPAPQASDQIFLPARTNNFFAQLIIGFVVTKLKKDDRYIATIRLLRTSPDHKSKGEKIIDQELYFDDWIEFAQWVYKIPYSIYPSLIKKTDGVVEATVRADKEQSVEEIKDIKAIFDYFLNQLPEVEAQIEFLRHALDSSDDLDGIDKLSYKEKSH